MGPPFPRVAGFGCTEENPIVGSNFGRLARELQCFAEDQKLFQRNEMRRRLRHRVAPPAAIIGHLVFEISNLKYQISD